MTPTPPDSPLPPPAPNRLVRALRHLWLDAADSARALPPPAAQRLAERIAASERRHTGEIRICLEASLPLPWLGALVRDPAGDRCRARAWHWFAQLGVWDTRDNNGVLIYLLLAERAIEVVADRGLAERLPAAHWRAVVDDLRGACRTGQWEAGLAQAVDAVTAVLAAHFPEDPDRPKANELPDAVVRC